LPFILEMDDGIGRGNQSEIGVIIEPAAEVETNSFGDRDGRIGLVSSDEDSFAACFAEGHGGWGGDPLVCMLVDVSFDGLIEYSWVFFALRDIVVVDGYEDCLAGILLEEVKNFVHHVVEFEIEGEVDGLEMRSDSCVYRKYDLKES